MPVFLHQYDTILQYNMTLMEQSKRYSKKFWRFAPQNPKHCLPKPIQSTESMLTADDSFASLLCNACQKPCLFAWCSGTDSLHCIQFIFKIRASCGVCHVLLKNCTKFRHIWYIMIIYEDNGWPRGRGIEFLTPPMEGYRIPDTFQGRGTEFLPPLMGGVRNSWPRDWRILYPPGHLNNDSPLILHIAVPVS